MFTKIMLVLTSIASVVWLITATYYSFYEDYLQACLSLLWYFVCLFTAKDLEKDVQ